VSDLVCRLRALADPVRMEILGLLPDEKKCEDVYNVSELAEELEVSQSTVSHHLGILRGAGLVRCQRMCRDVYYWIDQEAVAACLAEAGRQILPRK
jgi:ArsR family transcriptional regulator